MVVILVEDTPHAVDAKATRLRINPLYPYRTDIPEHSHGLFLHFVPKKHVNPLNPALDVKICADDETLVHVPVKVLVQVRRQRILLVQRKKEPPPVVKCQVETAVGIPPLALSARHRPRQHRSTESQVVTANLRGGQITGEHTVKDQYQPEDVRSVKVSHTVVPCVQLTSLTPLVTGTNGVVKLLVNLAAVAQTHPRPVKYLRQRLTSVLPVADPGTRLVPPRPATAVETQVKHGVTFKDAGKGGGDVNIPSNYLNRRATVPLVGRYHLPPLAQAKLAEEILRLQVKVNHLI